jgi:hypothetical protein
MRTVVKPAVRDLRSRHRAVGQDRRAWRAPADATWRTGQIQMSALRDAQAQGAENTKSALTTCMRKFLIIADAMFRNKNALANTCARRLHCNLSPDRRGS